MHIHSSLIASQIKAPQASSQTERADASTATSTAVGNASKPATEVELSQQAKEALNSTKVSRSEGANEVEAAESPEVEAAEKLAGTE